jgi:hypothetical protein
MSIAMILFIIFLVLKLAAIGAVATWSWWWVTAPLWLGFVFFFLVAIYLLAGVMFVFAGVDLLRNRKRRR